jgi:hypothetical protein
MLGGLGRAIEVLEHGAYTLSGQDAGFRRDLRVFADVGYIGIYGQVGILERAANSSGEAAPFPSMGTLFIQTYNNRTLTADPGIYSYVGSEALIDYEQDADTTTYTITGQGAGLLLGVYLFAESGSYDLTGQDADSYRGGPAQVMSADFGAYALSGQDAGVLSAYKASPEHGFYAVLGQTAITSVGVDGNTPIAADTDVYTITGFDAELTYYSPEISGVAVGVPGRGARRERYLAIINGKKHFGTREEIERLIESLAETQAEKPKKKRAKIVVKPAEPVSTATPEDKVDAAEVQADVRQMYEELYRKAVAELELQEEEDLIGLL